MGSAAPGSTFTLRLRSGASLSALPQARAISSAPAFPAGSPTKQACCRLASR